MFSLTISNFFLFSIPLFVNQVLTVPTGPFQTNNGVVVGQVMEIDGKQLNVFRGIPFAKPPIGNLRFKKPVPIGNWNEPKNVSEFQGACPQDSTRFHVGDYMTNKTITEDCLYLNVWSPVGSGVNGTLKPVMVWIHGGGLLVGSPSEYTYHAEVLAARGDVVVVTISYRLNIFGFLYSGDSQAPGNVGLLDQNLGLKWVKDNIHCFGGDPNQVTIFGESAGSWSVSLHVISPKSRNLFKNAIMNSGAYLNRFADDSNLDHTKRWLKGAARIGCSDPFSLGIFFTSTIMNCLRAANISELIKVTDFFDLITGSVKVLPLVVSDGDFLSHKPRDMLNWGNFKTNVNLMISTVEDEGAFLLNNFNDPVIFDFLNPKNMTYSEAYNYLQNMSRGMNSELPINEEDVAKLYFTGLSDNDPNETLLKTLGIATGDYFLACPTKLFAKTVFSKSNYQANVFEYYFNVKLQDNDICSYWMGACHASDLDIMFGIPFVDPYSNGYTDRDREISTQMMQFLTDFAKTGKPTPQNGAEWSSYFTIDDYIIAPYVEIENAKKNTSNIKIGLKIDACEFLWKKHITYNF